MTRSECSRHLVERTSSSRIPPSVSRQSKVEPPLNSSWERTTWPPCPLSECVPTSRQVCTAAGVKHFHMPASYNVGRHCIVHFPLLFSLNFLFLISNRPGEILHFPFLSTKELEVTRSARCISRPRLIPAPCPRFSHQAPKSASAFSSWACLPVFRNATNTHTHYDFQMIYCAVNHALLKTFMHFNARLSFEIGSVWFFLFVLF